MRHTALRWALWALGLVVLPAAAFVGWLWVDAGASNVGELTFDTPLRVPPQMLGEVDAEGRRHFVLRAQEGLSELREGITTPTWGVNGDYLGPTLVMRRGEEVRIDVHNELPAATTMHWHGAELPASADGGPHQLVDVGETWSPSWTVDQPAATLWYHPHPHGRTAQHVYRGVAGLLYVTDPTAEALALPDRYGVDDVPVVVQDKRFNADGSLDEDGITFGGLSIVGLLGDEILVNGTHDPHLDVVTSQVRLRLLNASNARVYDFGFSDDRSFAVIAGDGGLLTAPAPTSRIMLSPGERAEIVVEVQAGEEVVLRSFPPDLGANPLYERLAGGHDTFDVLQLRAAAELQPLPALPDALAPAGAPPVGDEPLRSFELGDFTINGLTFDMARIDEVVKAGSTEIWRIRNGQGLPHNFHVHGATFRILGVDGSEPVPWQAGRKDTVFVAPGQTVDVAITFVPHPDPDIAFMFHCHLLAHEDAGMMGQLVVVGSEQARRGEPSAARGVVTFRTSDTSSRRRPPGGRDRPVREGL